MSVCYQGLLGYVSSLFISRNFEKFILIFFKMAENIDLKYLKVNRSDFSDPVKAAEWAQKKLGMGFEVKIRKLKKIKHLPFLTIIK